MLRSHKNFFISWYRTMIDAVLNVVQGLLTIITLGWITKHMTFWYLRKCVKSDMKKKLENEKKDLTS